MTGTPTFVVPLDGTSLENTTTGLSINLGNANTWTGAQTFPSSSIANSVLSGPLVDSLTTESGDGITLTATNPTGVGAGYYTPSVTLGGDISGSSLSSMTVAKIDGVAVSYTSLSAGAILYYNGTDWINLAIGSSGQVLTVSSGEPAWAASAVSSVSNSDGTLTISPTTGAVVASLALGHANTWTATQTFPSGSIANSVLAGALVDSLTTESGGGITLTATNPTGVGAAYYTPSVTLGGDVSGSSLSSITVAKIDGEPVSYTSLAAGAILYYNGTDWVNLAIGTSGQVLTVSSGEPAWASSSSGAVSSVSNSDGTLTISPTTGAVVASLDLAHANTWTATQTFPSASIANSVLAGPLVDSLTTESGGGITLTATTPSAVGAAYYTPSVTLGGDISGSSLSSVTVANINGEPISYTSLAAGAILYYNGTDWVNLAVGSTGQFLTISSGEPIWSSTISGNLTVTGTSTLTGNVTSSATLGYTQFQGLVKTPSPGSTGPTWYLLGSWTFSEQGTRMAIKIEGGSGYNAGGANTTETHLIFSAGNNSTTPNIWCSWWTNGGGTNSLVAGVQAYNSAGGSASGTWDIYVQLNYGSGSAYTEVTTDPNSTWSFSNTTATPPSGSYSYSSGITFGNTLKTIDNILDDGSGNTTIAGSLTVSGQIEPSTVTNTGSGTWVFGSLAWNGGGPAAQNVNSVTGIMYDNGSGSQLFTISSGPAQCSIQLDGSIFIGDNGSPYNPFSISGETDGCLLVDNTASFGGDVAVNGTFLVNGTVSIENTSTFSNTLTMAGQTNILWVGGGALEMNAVQYSNRFAFYPSGSLANDNIFTVENSSYTYLFSVNCTTNATNTIHNTLDDGSGNVSILGVATITGGMNISNGIVSKVTGNGTVIQGGSAGSSGIYPYLDGYTNLHSPTTSGNNWNIYDVDNGGAVALSLSTVNESPQSKYILSIGSFHSTSDGRLKVDSAPTIVDMAAFRNIQVVDYSKIHPVDRTGDKEHKNEKFFINETTVVPLDDGPRTSVKAETLPPTIGKQTKDGIYTFDVGGLASHLVAVVQDMDKRLQAIEKKLG